MNIHSTNSLSFLAHAEIKEPSTGHTRKEATEEIKEPTTGEKSKEANKQPSKKTRKIGSNQELYLYYEYSFYQFS